MDSKNSTDLNSLCMNCMNLLSDDDVCPHCGFVEMNHPLSPHHLPLRTKLNGKYLIGRALGEGGFGITYIGWDLMLDLKIAIKEYYPSGFVTRENTSTHTVTPLVGMDRDFSSGQKKFNDEAKNLAQFDRLPGIVSVRDFFSNNGTTYMAMEYINGRTLKSYLAQKGGRLPAEQVFNMMLPVMNALVDVHKTGIIHRDISPDNIMIDERDNVKLLDFGSARDFLRNEGKSLTIMVKHGYAPEEQYRTRGNQGPWTDVYALSATMYNAITGQVPKEALERLRNDNVKKPSELGIHIDPEQEVALMNGMAILQENRYQSVAELAKALFKPPNHHSNPDDNNKRSQKEEELKSDNTLVNVLSKNLLQVLSAVLIMSLLICAYIYIDSLNGTGKRILDGNAHYEGDYTFNKPDGRGILIYPGGNKYEGLFENGEFVQGNVIITETNGNKYAGAYVNGKYNGRGILTSGGLKYIGNFKDGKKDGSGKLTDADEKKVLYEGDWQNDKREGHGVSLEPYEEGSVRYSGQWVDDKKNGYGESLFYNEAGYEQVRFKGNFIDNELIDENAEIWYSNGDYYKGGITNNYQRNGYGTYVWNSGQFKAGNWKNDQAID